MIAELMQADFYQEFLMRRNELDPQDYGINKERTALEDEIVEAFGIFSRGQYTVDELVLHPREALEFCDEFRRSKGYLYLPEDVILRTLMKIRKRGV